MNTAPRRTHTKKSREKSFIGKCASCKTGRRVDLLIEWTEVDDGVRWPRRENARVSLDGRKITRNHNGSATLECACGGYLIVKPLNGSLNESKRCGSRCQGATGPNCDCQCGGENHGKAHC